MKFAFLLLTCVVLRAAPVAVAYTESSVAAAGVPPCWVTSSVAPNPTVAVEWDTSGHHTNHLTGNASTGTSLTYSWSFDNNPGGISLSSTVVANPTVIGTPVTTTTATGTYDFTLTVTEHPSGLTSSATIHVGAISIDANGVVVPSDAKVTKIFNKMIAIGYNPWCYQDQEHIAAALLQIANNTYYSSMAASWSVSGQGTVAYPMGGIGFGQPGASVCGTTSCNGTTVSATALTLSIHNSERIPGLASLPTWIVVGGQGISGEIMRITATTATTGDATLTVAYDGRGISSYLSYNGNIPGAASMHPNNEVVGGQPITGTGTLFATDSQRPLCPAGVPGPPGPIAYSTGTVAVTAGSTTIVGSGTTWNTGSGVLQFGMIRVSGTTHSGTPFVFWRRISTVTDTTHIVVDHAYPSDADTLSGLSYKITGQFWVSLEFADTTYGGIHRALQNFQGCESETSAFSVETYDNPFNADNETGMHYSYKLSVGAQTQPNGPNFYGTDSAELSFYYRSGYTPALTASRLISDYFIRDPEMCGSYCAASPFITGGGWMGGAANTWLNGSALTSLTDLRPWAASAAASFANSHTVCNTGLDTRDQGYLASFLVLTAMIDVGGSFGSTWLTDLGSAGSGAGVLGRDQLCKQSDNSFAQGIVPPAAPPPSADAVLTLMHGDPVAHGTALPSNICAGVGSGTITVTNGSFSATKVTGTLGSLATNANIAIYDTTSTQHYVGFFQFNFSGTAVVLAAAWPGANGTFSYVVQDDSQLGRDNAVGINAIYLDGSDSDDIRMIEDWACTWNSSTQITFNRPWDDDVNGVPGSHTNGTYYLYASALHGVVVGGKFQQPYEFGIKSKEVNWAASYVPDATVNAGYSTVLGLMGQWFHDVAYDPYTGGAYYATVNLGCLPKVAPKSSSDPPDSSTFNSINPSCGANGLNGISGISETGEYPSRIYLVEGFDAIYAYFRAQCALGVSQCNAARTYGDKAYGAIWGDPAMTQSGYYSDSHFVSNVNGELVASNIGGPKWSGFFFGVGMSHVWPAMRLEGMDLGANRYPSSMRRPASSR